MAEDIGLKKKQFGSLEMVELNTEHERIYIYPGGEELRIGEITHLHIKKGPQGDSHILRDALGDMWYVRPGWLAIRFTELEGCTL